MKLDEAIACAREVVEENSSILKELSPSGRDASECIKCKQEHEQLAEWLEELKEYRTIGTPDECREAVEKQKERKPIKYDKTVPWAYACPKCGDLLIKTKYEYKYCDTCGQKLDWGDVE